MRDQVILAKNGNIAVAIPLFRLQESEELVNLGGYSVQLSNSRPIAYALDAGEQLGGIALVNAEVLEQNVEFLGDL